MIFGKISSLHFSERNVMTEHHVTEKNGTSYIAFFAGLIFDNDTIQATNVQYFSSFFQQIGLLGKCRKNI